VEVRQEAQYLLMRQKFQPTYQSSEVEEAVGASKAYQSRVVFEQIANYCINRLQAMKDPAKDTPKQRTLESTSPTSSWLRVTLAVYFYLSPLMQF